MDGIPDLQKNSYFVNMNLKLKKHLKKKYSPILSLIHNFGLLYLWQVNILMLFSNKGGQCAIS